MERSLGRVEGLIKGMRTEQRRQGKSLASIDGRMGAVERKAAKYSAATGGMAALIMMVGGEFIKKKLGL